MLKTISSSQPDRVSEVIPNKNKFPVGTKNTNTDIDFMINSSSPSPIYEVYEILCLNITSSCTTNNWCIFIFATYDISLLKYNIEYYHCNSLNFSCHLFVFPRKGPSCRVATYFFKSRFANHLFNYRLQIFAINNHPMRTYFAGFAIQENKSWYPMNS